MMKSGHFCVSSIFFPMNRPHSPEDKSRFNASVRHYHRAGNPKQRSWDDWVDSAHSDRSSSKNWFKIVGLTLAVLALGGIVTGLIIELS
jgi:hypothetical protein